MNKIVALLPVLLLSLSIAACGAGSTGDSAAKNGASPAASQPAVKPADAANATATKYPLKMKDTTGTEITLQKAPQRIVSTSTAETEILFALGLGDRIVA
ncbi:MAG: cobalamin-binding protein, partial [Paenibacillus sp.]|nr:cobalamin-binding protein [Paenibacillus sp.]